MPEASMPTIDEIRRETAEFLGLEPDEVNWISEETLASIASGGDLDGDDEALFTVVDEEPGELMPMVPPANRISYGNTFTKIPGHPHIYWWPNCQLQFGPPFIIARESFRRALRDGSCSNGNGGYIYRYKIWWRQG